jgi:hypothetical protein
MAKIACPGRHGCQRGANCKGFLSSQIFLWFFDIGLDSLTPSGRSLRIRHVSLLLNHVGVAHSEGMLLLEFWILEFSIKSLVLRGSLEQRRPRYRYGTFRFLLNRRHSLFHLENAHFEGRGLLSRVRATVRACEGRTNELRANSTRSWDRCCVSSQPRFETNHVVAFSFTILLLNPLAEFKLASIFSSKVSQPLLNSELTSPPLPRKHPHK